MLDAAIEEKVAELLTETQVSMGIDLSADMDIANAGPAPAGDGRRAPLEEGLERARLAVKYMVFDLEATRRENRMLREILGSA
jgi:hypothetical protein